MQPARQVRSTGAAARHRRAGFVSFVLLADAANLPKQER